MTCAEDCNCAVALKVRVAVTVTSAVDCNATSVLAVLIVVILVVNVLASVAENSLVLIPPHTNVDNDVKWIDDDMMI